MDKLTCCVHARDRICTLGRRMFGMYCSLCLFRRQWYTFKQKVSLLVLLRPRQNVELSPTS
jgi:hypothetical protein